MIFGKITFCQPWNEEDVCPYPRIGVRSPIWSVRTSSCVFRILEKRATWILSSCARLRLAYPPTFPSWIHKVLQNALYSSVRVNQKSDCRLVKNHQFACIHVGNKGGVRSQNFRARREPSTQTWWFDLFAYHGASAAPCVYPLARSAGVFLSRFKEI